MSYINNQTAFPLIDRDLDAKHIDYYDRVLAVVIESGLVYTASLVAQLVLSLTNSTGTYIIIGIDSQIVVGVFDSFLIHSLSSYPSLNPTLSFIRFA